MTPCTATTAPIPAILASSAESTPRIPPAQSCPLIRAADLDAAYEQVTSAGGKIVKEPYDFPGSFRFCFTTPAGHELGAWTPAAKLTDTRDTVSHARAL
ncbi:MULTISPECIES: VOC family protein [Corynebacterium]|uniref:VOC family protein n=1 Tax=Corynebacterium TaxID=1716 RepID=UPI00330720AC